MRTIIITICLLLLGITVQAQQALQKYYTATQALEGQADSEEKSKTRGKALAVFHDERVKEAGTETAKNEAGKLFRQYLDYDLYAAFYFLMRLSNSNDMEIFLASYSTQDERAKIKLLANRNVTAYNTQSGQSYPYGVPYPGNGVKGSWQNSGIFAALKDPNSNLASNMTGTSTATDDGTEEFQKGAAFYQAKNYTEAFHWYRKAAEKEETGAMYMLGLMYLDGIGTTQNIKEAKNWLQKSADKGEEKAKEKLKTLQSQTAIADNGETEYSKGDAAYNKKQYTEAMEWFKKSAEKGNSIAMFSIGAMYFDGEGVSTNYSLAKKWLEKALEKGDLPIGEQLTANALLDTIEKNN